MLQKGFWKPGERQMAWLDRFAIAIATKDTKEISSLLDDMPKFEKVEDMKKAQFLIKDAYELVSGLKDETKKSMQLIKKNIEFLQNSSPIAKNSLDVTY